MITTWISDAGQGIRRFWRHRGVAVPAVAALALGIGATTAMLSVGYTILLRPFPYRDAGRLVVPQVQDLASQRERESFTVPEIRAYQQDGRVFQALLPARQENTIVDDGRMKVAVMAAVISSNTFDELGVAALIGRGISTRDGDPDAEAVFVLGHKAWQGQFAADPGIIGRKFIVQDEPRTLIGVTPPRFAWGGGEMWVPVDLARVDTATYKKRFTMTGRLRADVSLAEAPDMLTAAARGVAATYPTLYPERFAMRATSLVDYHVGDFRRTLYALLGAVGLLLLISCANVAGLLMAQAVERRPELAARAALGASRARLVRQLVLEALTLALVGGLLGTGLAWLGLRALAPLLPEMTLPDEMRIGLNLPMLAASLVVAMAAGVLASAVPALRMTRGDLAADLRTGARAIGRGGHARTRALFVLTQVVLSLVLLVGAGLLARSFATETRTQLGYAPDRMLFAWLVLPPGSFATGPGRAEALDRIVDRLRRLPGVRGIGAGQFFPPMGGVPTELEAEGSAAGKKMGDLAVTSRTFFDVLGIEPLAGRLLTDDDAAQQRKVAVVNERLASEFFGSESPLGRRVRIAQLAGGATPVADPWFEIVGIVRDLKNAGVREAVVPGIYISHSFATMGGFGIVLETDDDPRRLATPMARAIQEVQPAIVPQYTKVLADWIESFYFARPRFSLALVSLFTGVGLLLTSVGVYSVVSFAVAQRHRELGIRMSLGASPRAVVRTVLAGTLAVVGAGLLMGHALAAYVARLMAANLWGIAPHDPATLLTSTGLILLIAALACALPARRAARLNPADVLRGER